MIYNEERLFNNAKGDISRGCQRTTPFLSSYNFIAINTKEIANNT